MKRSSAKILIAGYYGMGNLGDEIILSELVRRIRLESAGAGVDCRIKALSGDTRFTAANTGVSAVSGKSPLGVAAALASSDILIIGGGGIFQDRTSSLSLYYYLSLIVAAKLLGKKVSVCAVGIDRLKAFNAFLTRRALSLADSISVRDDESRDFASSFRGDVLRAADIATALSDDFVRRAFSDGDAREKSEAAAGKKIILVPRRFRRSDVHFWARLADACSRRFGARIKVMPFHKKEDFKYATRIAGAMDAPCEIIVWENIESAAAEFATADVVISARLHGIILAAALGVPVCGISADRKSDLFLREIGQKNIYGRPDDFERAGEETAVAVIADTIRWADDFRRSLAEASSKLRRMVEPSVAAALSALDAFALNPRDYTDGER
ncbi:MAG: polysaccharide pyruvyl transferase CsaB [Endomicrobiia bacterium]|nr:polysaccharide pyruvyl transferase CsaB [Endomicrobiia bacterium]